MNHLCFLIPTVVAAACFGWGAFAGSLKQAHDATVRKCLNDCRIDFTI